MTARNLGLIVLAVVLTAIGPWLRLGIQTEDWRAVVLDETAARALAADLLAWADREHVQPKEET